MSEEENEAIEQLKKLKEYKTTYYGSQWFKVEVCANEEMKNTIDTALNLIQKQQEEIELLKEQKQYVIDEYEETIEKKDKIINELEDKISLIETYYDISDLDRIVKEDM